MLEEQLSKTAAAISETNSLLKALTDVMTEVSKHQRSLLEKVEEAHGDKPAAKSSRRSKKSEEVEAPAAKEPAAPVKAAPAKAEPVSEVPSSVGSAKDEPLETKSDAFVSGEELVKLGRTLVSKNTDPKDIQAAVSFIRDMGYSTGAYVAGETVKLGGEACKLSPEQRNLCAFYLKRAAKLGLDGVTFGAAYDLTGAVDQPEPTGGDDDTTTTDDLDMGDFA